MIAIKDVSVLMQVLTMEYHPKLILIMSWLTTMYDRTVITSAYRGGDKGVHGTDPCRGIDIRSWVFSNPRKVTDKINLTWEYDPDRPDKRVGIYHDIGSGEHIHLQVHDNTERRRNAVFANHLDDTNAV